ncbi:MAG: hypothetical protein HUJ60_03475, partial [Bacilli bacterium]|nr:hypothetical protein [Bacilli bacterium]
NGNGVTIKNLTVDNFVGEGHITKKPSAVPTGALAGTTVEGAFGAIGNNLMSYGQQTPYTLDGYTPSVSNVKFQDLTISVSQSSSLVGAAVGYQNASLSDVALIDADITFLNQTYPIYGQTNVSNYTSVGYAEADYLGTMTENIRSIKTPSVEHVDTNAKSTGSAAAWGGSIGMNTLFTRLETFRTDTARKTQFQLPTEHTAEKNIYRDGVLDETTYTTTNSENVNSYQWKDVSMPLKGKVTFSGQNQGVYLWGIRNHDREYTVTNEYHNDDDPEYIYLKSGSYYLYFNGGNASRSTTNVTHLYTDSNGYIYYSYNNQNYYLYCNSTTDGTLRSGRGTQTYMFKVDGSRLRLYNGNTAQSRYVRYYGGFSVNGSGTTGLLNYDTEYTTETYVDHVIEHRTEGTYLPLNAYEPNETISQTDRDLVPGEVLDTYSARPTNTGYIVGGVKDQSDNYGSGVRMDKKSNQMIQASLGGTTTYSGSNLQILTRTKDSNGPIFIEDTYNQGVALSSTLTSLSYVPSANRRKVSYQDLGLEKYKDSRDQLDQQLKTQGDDFYCLRFNEFDISKDNLVIADKVLLNKEIKTDYELPESCVDFHLKEKGYINFFGCSGRGADPVDAFFSLNHIKRDAADKIIAIKEMSKVYGNESDRKASYVYEYKDGTFAIYDADTKTFNTLSAVPSGYTMFFDLKWVTEPGFERRDYVCWYLEIPVTPGEYALGSAKNSKNSTGGYMCYLDVGSAASKVHRTVTVEKVTSTTNTYTHPTGVAFAASADTEIDNAHSNVAVIIPAGFAGGGHVSITTTDDQNFEITASANLSASYVKPEVTLMQNGAAPPMVTESSTTDPEVIQMTYSDYNLNNYSLTTIVITDTDGTRTATKKVVNDEGETTETLEMSAKIWVVDEEGTGQETTVGAIDIDTTGLPGTDLVNYTVIHYGEAIITVEWAIDFVLEDPTGEDIDLEGYYLVQGYHITIVGDVELDVYVTFLDGTYTVYINDEAVAQGDIIVITPTTPEG